MPGKQPLIELYFHGSGEEAGLTIHNFLETEERVWDLCGCQCQWKLGNPKISKIDWKGDQNFEYVSDEDDNMATHRVGNLALSRTFPYTEARRKRNDLLL